MPKKQKDDLDLKRVDKMRASSIHGIKPLGFRLIKLKHIHLDPTNPGNDRVSQRRERRWPAMRDSFYILNSVVYPLVVTERKNGSEEVDLVDGHGRFELAQKMGIDELWCIVYPPLQLEDRIRLRQVLGAAQEPFDAPLVLKDLRLLAERRGLDLSKGDDMDLLLADLPIDLADKAQKQLKLLAKWPSDMIHRVAVEHDDQTGVLGIDMLKELDSVVNAVKRNHPTVFKTLGEDLREKTLEVYFGGNLRAKGQRSQDALRDLRKLLKDAPKNDQRIAQLFNGDIRYPRFKTALEAVVDETTGAQPIREYIAWAASYTGKLTAEQRQLLQRAVKLSKGLLDAEEAVPASA